MNTKSTTAQKIDELSDQRQEAWEAQDHEQYHALLKQEQDLIREAGWNVEKCFCIMCGQEV